MVISNGTVAPSANGNGKHPPHSAKDQKKFLRNPTGAYQTQGMGWWGYGSQALDGRPVFTWFDIPRMLTDPRVRFISSLWRAPFQKVKTQVKASSEPVAKFVQSTIKKFWRKSLPQLLSKYWRYGYCAGGAEFTVRNGWMRLDRVKAMDCNDVLPHLWKTGPDCGQFAGFELNRQNRYERDKGSIFVSSPHAFWFSGFKEYGEYYDTPPISGLFEPWLEKRGRNGAIHARRHWFRRGAWLGKIGYYPRGTTMTGPDESPTERDNQDIMREVLDYADSGSTMLFVNDVHPGIDGEYDWKVEHDVPQADIAGFRDYPKDLDDEMLEGSGIPKEVVASSESGSGYNGRMVPYQGFLGIVDELSGMILDDCEMFMQPLVAFNFGPDAWYEIETMSLADQVEKEQLEGQKRSGEFQAKESQAKQVPFDLSTTDTTISRAIADLNRKVDQVLQLSATATDEDDRESKDEAFKATNQKLMRSRKATIAQLLALAMVRSQQRATLAGKPEEAAGSLSALADMAGDPVAVARIVGMKLGGGDDEEMSALEMSWSGPFPGTRKKGAIFWVNDETQERRYQKSKPGERKEKQEASEVKAKEILTKVAKKTATLEDVAELGDHLPVVRAKTLRKFRDIIEFNLRGERKKNQMVERLLDHVSKGGGGAGHPEVAKRDAERTAVKAQPAVAPVEKPVPPPKPAAPIPELAEPASVAAKPALAPKPKKEPAKAKAAKPAPAIAPAPKVEPEVEDVNPDEEGAQVSEEEAKANEEALRKILGSKEPQPEEPQAAEPEEKSALQVKADDAIRKLKALHDKGVAKDNPQLMTASKRAKEYISALPEAQRAEYPVALGGTKSRSKSVLDADDQKQLEAMRAKMAAKPPPSAVAPKSSDSQPKSTGKAHVVPPKDFVKLIKGGGRELFRGVGKKEHADQFASGELRVGKGSYGDGVYVGYGTNGFNAASQNSGDDGYLASMVMKPDAKVQTWDEAETAWNAHKKDSPDSPYSKIGPGSPYRNSEEAIAAYSKSKGIQAIDVQHNQFMNILDPAAVVVKHPDDATPGGEEAKVPEAVKAKVAEEVAKPVAKHNAAPGVAPVEHLQKEPGADRNYLGSLAKSAPAAAKDFYKTALHNLANDDDEIDPEERRRDTIRQLASNWRAASELKDAASAKSLAEAVGKFGGELAGPASGQTAKYNGALYDSVKGVGKGDSVKVVRQPVIFRGTNGTYVMVKGVISK